ncbi:hypothetical protein HAX54_034917, partial [Datura stramonium]|nr:hypothetical protein [Datura stramonium]
WHELAKSIQKGAFSRATPASRRSSSCATLGESKGGMSMQNQFIREHFLAPLK